MEIGQNTPLTCISTEQRTDLNFVNLGLVLENQKEKKEEEETHWFFNWYWFFTKPKQPFFFFFFVFIRPRGSVRIQDWFIVSGDCKVKYVLDWFKLAGGCERYRICAWVVFDFELVFGIVYNLLRFIYVEMFR